MKMRFFFSSFNANIVGEERREKLGDMIRMGKMYQW
jgi:hypothetical protein